jgi:hypothetical protein
MSQDVRVALDDARKLSLPRAVADDGVDVRLARIGRADRLNRLLKK